MTDFPYSTEQIELKIKQFYTAQLISRDVLESAVTPEACLDYHLGFMAHQLIVRVAVPARETQVARYPTTWWDAVKARFAPPWFLRRWPADYIEVRLEELYHMVAIPEKKPALRLIRVRNGIER